MPLYDYRCKNCGKTFTAVLSLKERERGQVVCPGCGLSRVEPLMSPFMAKTDRKS
jgi:putative FmdB family regulatory protein